MTNFDGDCVGGLLNRQPERLVVRGFRNCMAGYDHSDIDCWENTLQLYIVELGSKSVCHLIGEQLFWVRSVRQNTQRSLSYYPQYCQHLSFDECMALSAIAAAQSSDEETGHLALNHLLGCNDFQVIENGWSAAQGFAAALSQWSLPLLAVSVRVVESISTMHQHSANTSQTLN